MPMIMSGVGERMVYLTRRRNMFAPNRSHRSARAVLCGERIALIAIIHAFNVQRVCLSIRLFREIMRESLMLHNHLSRRLICSARPITADYVIIDQNRGCVVCSRLRSRQSAVRSTSIGHNFQADCAVSLVCYRPINNKWWPDTPHKLQWFMRCWKSTAVWETFSERTTFSDDRSLFSHRSLCGLQCAQDLTTWKWSELGFYHSVLLLK